MRKLTTLMIAAGLITACTNSPAKEDYGLSGRIILTGDSTASTYLPRFTPRTGWGQVFDYFVTDEAEVINLAADGRSTKTYIEEGRWDTLIEQVGPGDLVLLTFGHNDAFKRSERRYAAADGAFRENMIRFANEVQQKGGFAVIMSPVARRNFKDGIIRDSFPDYRANAEIAAQQSGIPFFDLTGVSMAYVQAMGVENSKKDFMWLTVDEMGALDPVYLQRNETDLQDDTHFTELGACGIARTIARELPAVFPPFKTLIANAYTSLPPITSGERTAEIQACAKDEQAKRKAAME